MFTVAAVASHLQISDESVLALIRSGRLRGVNVGLGVCRPRWRVSQEAINEFVAARGSQPKPMTRRRKQSVDVVDYF